MCSNNSSSHYHAPLQGPKGTFLWAAILYIYSLGEWSNGLSSFFSINRYSLITHWPQLVRKQQRSIFQFSLCPEPKCHNTVPLNCYTWQTRTRIPDVQAPFLVKFRHPSYQCQSAVWNTSCDQIWEIPHEEEWLGRCGNEPLPHWGRAGQPQHPSYQSAGGVPSPLEGRRREDWPE